MIGQHHHGVDRKRMARLREPRRRTQRIDTVRQKAAPPVQQIDGEEPASARHQGAAIVRHGGNDPYVDGPRPARGGAASGSDRLRSYVRPVDAVAHDLCQDGFRDMSSKQYGGFEDCHWIVRSVSCLGSIDRTICSVSSKPRLQREAMVALTPNSLSCSQYSYPALSGGRWGAWRGFTPAPRRATPLA